MLAIDWNPPERQLRQFGWIALFGFPLLGIVLLGITAGAPPWAQITVSGLGPLTLVLSIVSTAATRLVYVALMVIAVPIGFVISTVLLALIYYGLFTPVGLLFRLFGRDPLAKRPDPAVASYWHVRGEPREPASYLRLY